MKIFNTTLANHLDDQVTCDFDLLQEDPSILEHLPTECKKAYQNVDLANKMRYESKLFQEFQDKLTKYEIENSDDPDSEMSQKWDFRFSLYNNTPTRECYTNSTLNELTDCLIRNRLDMMDEIPVEWKIEGDTDNRVILRK